MTLGEVIVRLHGIKKSFAGREVLKGVSLEVRRGEVIVLMGSSGSGKTTLLRCINLLEEPDEGTVEIGGRRLFHNGFGGRPFRVSERELNQSRAKAGMVFQQFNLFPHMTVIENVMEGLLTVIRKSREEARETALAMLHRMGLASHAGKYPHQVSGGQQQRIAIARALVMAPDVMLFDEVTSALDPELVGEVLLVMRELAHAGMTMVVVTHEIGFAYQVGDRLLFLDGGEIRCYGKAQELLAEPQDARLKEFLGHFHETISSMRPLIEAQRLNGR